MNATHQDPSYRVVYVIRAIHLGLHTDERSPDILINSITSRLSHAQASRQLSELNFEVGDATWYSGSVASRRKSSPYVSLKSPQFGLRDMFAPGYTYKQTL